MRYYSSQLRRIAAIVACYLASAISTGAMAQEDGSVLVDEPAPPALEQPAPSPQPQATTAELLPAPIVSEGVVHPAPPIKYRTSRSARRMFRSQETVALVMVTRNPADGCVYEIPICIPACCVGEPIVDERCGLGGRGVVEYCWECGFSATVKFRHRLGDVKVQYDT